MKLRKIRRRQSPSRRRRLARRLLQPFPRLDPGNDPAHRSSLALRLVRKLPTTVVNSPERVVLNASFVLIGLTAFISATDQSIIMSWPEWIKVAFALGMTVGGGAVLCGMFRGLTSVERLGYVLVAPACLFYAVTVLVLRGATAVPVFLIFLGLAASKIVRLVISSAERDMTIELGERLDREALDHQREEVTEHDRGEAAERKREAPS